MIHFLVLFIIALLPESRAASETNLSHTVFGTSSEYHSKSWELAGNINDGNVFVDARYAEGEVVHNNFKMDRITVGHRFNRVKSRPALRVGNLSREYLSKKTNVPIMTLRGEENLNEKLFYTYQIGYVPMSEEFQTAFTVKEILRGGLASLGGSYRWSEKWRSTYYFQHYFFNDDNTRLNHDVALFYAIAPGDPWIWVGLGGSRLSNTNTESAYWVPREFYTIGPRFDFSFSFWEKFRISAGLNLNYFKDIETGEGTGYYFNSKVLYKFNTNFDLYSGVESIQSQQLGNIWRSHGISAGLTGRW